jgi:hypothetical protein
MPDLNTENPHVVNTLYRWVHDLVQTYKIDALRIDTVKHIRKDFWPGFVNAAGVASIGEVLHGGECTDYVTVKAELQIRRCLPRIKNRAYQVSSITQAITRSGERSSYRKRGPLPLIQAGEYSSRRHPPCTVSYRILRVFNARCRIPLNWDRFSSE